MVERLKNAIDKARESRGLAPGPPSRADGETAAPRAREGAAKRPAQGGEGARAAWAALEEARLDPERLRRERIITQDKVDPAHMTFDVLRTRLLRALRENDWTRIAITSPSKGCGKTVVSANLALSLARQREARTVLIDMDLRAPHLAHRLSLREPRAIESWLSGQIPSERYLMRVGDNLALGLNTERVRDSAELVQSERATATLAAMMSRYRPDIAIYDLPPILVSDDAMAFLPQVDCVLLIAAAGQTRAEEIEECERLLADQTHFLGVLLNKAEGAGTTSYQYEYY